eukprot:2058296-Prymnesium_polylepis.2
MDMDALLVFDQSLTRAASLRPVFDTRQNGGESHSHGQEPIWASGEPHGNLRKSSRSGPVSPGTLVRNDEELSVFVCGPFSSRKVMLLLLLE